MPAVAFDPNTSYGVEATLEAGRLHCRLADGVPRDDGVIWTLHRGDLDPRRASEPEISGHEWQVRLPDRTNGYTVTATVDGVTHHSQWFQHFSRDAVLRYAEWRGQSEVRHGSPIAEIPLFRYEPPFENIAFACHSTETSLANLKKFAAESDHVVEEHAGVHWPRLTVLSGTGSVEDAVGTQYVFSGTTRNSEQLLLGTADVEKAVPDIQECRDGLGEFHLLTWTPSLITFSHDYIGQGHLFYYESDDMFVAANGLHLLVLTLRALGVELEIDAASAKSKFFSTSYPFETEQSSRTDFVGVQRLSVYESIEISASGVSFPKTELWHDDVDGDLSEALYEDLLQQAKADIIDNVRIALAHPKFENVVVELSAGLDSRIIFSALTNLPPSDKVRIYTRRGAEERTAAKINNLYAYSWDNLPKAFSFDVGTTMENLPSTSHSVFMDGYYIESMFKMRQNYLRPTLLLTGHGGEAFSRVMSVEGFFARDFSGKLVDPVDSVEEIYKNVIRYVGNHQVWLEVGKDYFPRILEDCLQESPSEVFQKRFADLYVSERNPFVGGSVFRGAMSAPQWRPLQSKALFRLKALWFQHRQDFRLQFDLIRALNPLVSEAPYLKDVENARKDEFHGYRAPFSITAPIEFDDAIASLTAARAEGLRHSTWLPSRVAVDAIKARTQEYEESAESFLEPLGRILALAPELEDMGLPLFTYIDRVINRPNPRAFSKRHNVRNKLHILLQELLISTSSRHTA